jgi:hypothetical protein
VTLGELMRRRRAPMEVGDFEFVEGKDGLAHRLILVRIDDGRGGNSLPSFVFMCPCGALHELRTHVAVLALLVAKGVTCMRCNAVAV